MWDFKLLLLLVFTCQTFKMNTCETTVLAPIRGLFNMHSDYLTKKVFNHLVGMRRGYYGNEVSCNVTDDGYSASLELCSDTSDDRGASAILDARPSYGICDNICLLCSKLQIPRLSLAWESPETPSEDHYTFYYHPPPEIISKAFAAHIKKMDWDRFSILYEDEGSFIRLQEVINSWRNDLSPITFKRLYYDGDNKETFKYIFKVARLSYHIIDCEADHVLKYMEEIQQVENYTVYQSILLTSLDAHTIDMKSIEYGPSVATWHLTQENNVQWNDLRVSNGQPKVETALAVDALNHFGTAMRVFESSAIGNEDYDETTGLFGELPSVCYRKTKDEFKSAAWPMGPDLRNNLLETSILGGLTGNVQFDDNGKRINFELHYSKLNNRSEYVYTGKWDSATGKIKDLNAHSVPTVRSTELKVVTKEGKPYFTPGVNGSEPQGYVVDFMNEIFEHIRTEQNYDLHHTIELRPDNKYGNPIEGSRRWDGLIGELLEHRAAFAVCDLTITSDRNAVVDFSIPFMSLGISMLAKVDEVPDPDMFSFVNPLSTDVWLYLAVVYILVSLVLLVCARMSQDDWVNPHPCNRNPENLENIWSLYNCMWLTMGSIMTQGCDILPRGYGSRWIAGTWYFFALIVTASYTANMSTFISNSRRSNNIENVNDLAEQTEVSYGALYNGSTYKFFESSNDTVYQKIWQVMNSANPTVFTNTNEEGKERVIRSNGKYVFFMESTSIEYHIKQDCRLKMIGSKLDSKDYGIAMPKNSPYRHLVNNAILYLQESGKLGKLKDKWWVKEDPEAQEGCEKFVVSEGDDSGSVQMKNTSGIFLVLGCGGVLGFIIAIIAFLMHAHEICVQEKLPFKQVLSNEWRASLDPRVLIKPVAPHSTAGSTKSPSPTRERSQSRAVSVLRAAQSFINFNEIY